MDIKVINLGSDTFSNPIFQKGLQNQNHNWLWRFSDPFLVSCIIDLKFKDFWLHMPAVEAMDSLILYGLKMFLKPVWEGKIHGVTKIGIFRPLFCVNMLGKSTNYSTGTRPLCSTF